MYLCDIDYDFLWQMKGLKSLLIVLMGLQSQISAAQTNDSRYRYLYDVAGNIICRIKTIPMQRQTRPTHLLFCSNRMMRLIKENKLKGFEFEVAHIVEDTHED